MTQTSPFRFLPIILVALALGAALFVAKERQGVKDKLTALLNKTKQVSIKLPEPTPFIPVKQFENEAISPTPTATPALTTPTLAVSIENQTKGGTDKTVGTKTVANTKTGTETVCTPVYGMANSCAEHTVVDTGLETEIFPGLALVSYLGGLAAFIKAKKRA